MGGKEAWKYENAYEQVKKQDLGDDVLHSMNMEDLVSMNELMQIASKVKEEDKLD